MPRVIENPTDLRIVHKVIEWQKLLDGRQYRLIRGEDFANDTAVVRAAAYVAAKRAGMRVITRKAGDDLIVQFFKKQATS